MIPYLNCSPEYRLSWLNVVLPKSVVLEAMVPVLLGTFAWLSALVAASGDSVSDGISHADERPGDKPVSRSRLWP